MGKIKKSYKNYVCPYCFRQINKCTCELPVWHLIMVDNSIQEHIQILNKKGYKTTGCCESHYDDNSICIYITFGVDYGFGRTIPLPDGFKVIKSKHGIEYRFRGKLSEEERNAQKEQKLAELLEWCKNLPNNN